MRDTQSEPFPFKRALVTGGCGFIGRHVVRRLLDDGWKVTVLDDLSTGSYDTGMGYDFVRGDVCDYVDVLNAANEYGHPDLVIHAASVVGQLLAKGDHMHSFNVSVDGTSNVLAATPGVPIVYLSSSAVYGHDHEYPVKESDASMGDALSYDGGYEGYAVGKLLAEQMVLSDDRRSLVLRPFNVVGPGQSAAYGMVLPRLVKQAVAGEGLTVYDDGGATRSFGHVSTFVDVLMRLIDKGATGILNVGNPRSCSIYALALEIALRVQGVPITTKPYSQVFPGHEDVRVRVPNVSALEAAIGPTDWPTIEQIVEEMFLCRLSK